MTPARFALASVAALALALAVSCKKKDRDEPGPAGDPAEAQAGEEEAAEATPGCPETAELGATLREVWEVAAGDRVEVVACAAGRFPEPGWFVIAWIDSGDDPDFPADSALRQEILALSGKPIAAAAQSDVPPPLRAGGLSFSDARVLDLDGDGADEILFHEHLEYREIVSSSLAVLVRDGDALRSAGVIPLEREISAYSEDEYELVSAVSCKATVDIGEPEAGVRALRVTGTIDKTSTDHDEDIEDCILGDKTLRLDGARLRESD